MFIAKALRWVSRVRAIPNIRAYSDGDNSKRVTLVSRNAIGLNLQVQISLFERETLL